MRHIIMINPAAGKADMSSDIEARAQCAFSRRNLDYTVMKTEHPGHATELAREIAADGEDAIIYVCGGDGTLSEVVNGIAGSDRCAVAHVPIGSGNDFIRCFGDGAQEAFSSFDMLLDGEILPIDLLRVDDRVCINIVSAGFDAAVCERMPLYKRLLPISGSTAYNLSLVHCFFTAVKNRYAFEIDGRAVPPGDYVFAVAANGRCYGGGYCAAPYAELNDGLIDLVRIPSLPRAKMLSMVSCYRRGDHLEKYDFISFERCRSVRYLADNPIPMNLDGEIIPMTNPLVTIMPSALRIVVPAQLAAKCRRRADAKQCVNI